MRIVQHVATMLTEPVRPFDWVMLGIEVAVLAVIILFEWDQWWHRFTAKRKIRPLPTLLDKGRNLLNSLPQTNETVQWVFDVEQWNEDTASALYLISPNLCHAFNLTRDLASAESVIHRGSSLPIRLEGETRDAYQRLQIRLDTLRRIVTKPEEYL